MRSSKYKVCSPTYVHPKKKREKKTENPDPTRRSGVNPDARLRLLSSIPLLLIWYEHSGFWITTDEKLYVLKHYSTLPSALIRIQDLFSHVHPKKKREETENDPQSINACFSWDSSLACDAQLLAVERAVRSVAHEIKRKKTPHLRCRASSRPSWRAPGKRPTPRRTC